jgi:hypothetical protein
MIVLGLLLIVLAGAALVAVANEETTGVTASITVLDRTIQFSQLELFLAGAATAAVFLVGLLVLSGGMRRAGVRRRRLREARHETRDRVARLEAEKRQLERQLAADAAAAPVTAPSDTHAGRHAHVPDRDGDGTQPVRAEDEPYHTDQLVAGNRSHRDAGA